jgi:hypothetical protein
MLTHKLFNSVIFKIPTYMVLLLLLIFTSDALLPENVIYLVEACFVAYDEFLQKFAQN